MSLEKKYKLLHTEAFKYELALCEEGEVYPIECNIGFFTTGVKDLFSSLKADYSSMETYKLNSYMLPFAAHLRKELEVAVRKINTVSKDGSFSLSEKQAEILAFHFKHCFDFKADYVESEEIKSSAKSIAGQAWERLIDEKNLLDKVITILPAKLHTIEEDREYNPSYIGNVLSEPSVTKNIGAKIAQGCVIS